MSKRYFCTFILKAAEFAMKRRFANTGHSYDKSAIKYLGLLEIVNGDKIVHDCQFYHSGKAYIIDIYIGLHSTW